MILGTNERSFWTRTVIFVRTHPYLLKGYIFSGNVETVTSRGADYAERSNIHQTSEVTTEGVITQWDQSHPYGVNPVYA